MRCEKVLGHMSVFVDEMLEDPLAAGIRQHLRDCAECSREYERTRRLRHALMSMRPERAPAYLRSLVQMRIVTAHSESWLVGLRGFLEIQWSRIRTLEGIWYLTRLAGTMATIVLFMAISAAIKPIYLEFGSPLPVPAGVSQSTRSQLPISVVDSLQNRLLSNLGMTPREAQRPISSSNPKINPLYLVNLGQSTSRTADNDTVSVVAVIDRSGSGTVQNILEYPNDESLLSEFTDMITSAGWRPASQNGRAVDSRLVLTFSKVYVFN